ncbi:MFS family permease [Bradyrhizobium sp. LB7.1]
MELQRSPAPNDGPVVSTAAAVDRIIETSIPSRLDALPWSGFHTRVVLALGITWILDGLEVTLAGALSGALKQSPTMRFSNLDLGVANSAYLAGAVLGALGFGWLTDRIGRKKLFFITLALYLSATAATALSWNVASYALFRFLTGAGIGGEYTAINSTIQELVPARYRGWTDLVINGSFWIGAAMGAVAAIVLLDPVVIGPDLGWRLAYLIGAAIGLVVLLMRMWIPESPRWLMIHGHPDRAHKIVDEIERSVIGRDQDTSDGRFTKIRLKMRDHTPIREVVHTLFSVYRQRAMVGLVLMIAQAFFYNAIFFTFALVLTDFYGISADHVGWYLLSLRRRKFPWSVAARPAVRYARPPHHDHVHLWRVGPVAGAVRLSVFDRRAERTGADYRVDGDFLLCLARRERRLSHRQRDFPPGGPRAGDRGVLRGRHRHRRRDRPRAIRRADRYGITHKRVRGLFAGVIPDDRGRDRGMALCRLIGTQIARRNRAAASVYGVDYEIGTG